MRERAVRLQSQLFTRVPINNGVGVAPARTPPPEEPKVIPAVAPLRVLPIDIPKQGGLIPDIKLGSGANMKLYGFFKASAVYDTASSGGPTFGSQDFPLPLLLADTGPTSDPQVHIKARGLPHRQPVSNGFLRTQTLWLPAGWKPITRATSQTRIA